MKKLSIYPLAFTPHPDQILGVFNGFTLEVCMNEASKNAAFRLRYHAYLEVQAIGENEAEMLYDEYDFKANARIFLVWHQDKPVATMRSCVYSGYYDWMPIESHHYFSQDLNDQFGAKTSLLEANRFAVAPEFQGSQSLFARLLLFRAHGLNAAAHQSDYILTLVRDRHQAFYIRYLGLKTISTQPHHVSWANAYVFAMANQTQTCLQKVLERGMPAYDREDVLQYAFSAQLNDLQPQRIAA